MNRTNKHLGFSLTEMLIATGIMAIGLMMVATIFPVGVKLTTLATERTIGAVVADEAFAKVRLYGLRDFQYWLPDPNRVSDTCSNYQFRTRYAGPDAALGTPDDNLMTRGPDGVWNTADDILWDTEFRYPSDPGVTDEYGYYWSALCRRVSGQDVQVTVFVSRKTANGTFRAQNVDWNVPAANAPWPQPVVVGVQYDPAFPTQLLIQDGPGSLQAAESHAFFDGGYTIVDDYSGRIYKVLEVKRETGTLVLSSGWKWKTYDLNPLNPPASLEPGYVWVVPPAVGSDRYPCVGVYQKVIRFDDLN